MEDSSSRGGAEKELFSLSEPLSLEWSDAAGVFVPRTASDDFARIDEIWGEGSEGFGKRYAERLRHLGQNGTGKQRNFIREHFGRLVRD